MSIDLWLAFLAATIVLLIIPGPTILLVVSYALGQGWHSALPISIGVALGDFTAMTLSLLGVGALLSASATTFTLLKWAGAAYLIYLGIKLWRTGNSLNVEARTGVVSTGKMLVP
jgi:homoserine/homoserine lactone efflux protein